MAAQYWRNRGEPRHTLVSFQNCYHGETFGAMSLGRGGVFSQPFESLLFDVVQSTRSLGDLEGAALNALEAALDRYRVAAFVYEPLLQGAGGMVIYEAKLSEPLLTRCKAAGVLCVADEVAVGFGG